MTQIPKSKARPRRRPSVFQTTLRSKVLAPSKGTNLDHLYLGRAGEAYVTAQLLRRGLNAATAPVDSGVDILAHKELRTSMPLLQAEHLVYQFQVKTTAIDAYRSSLTIRRVHELWHKVINLIVVFWNDKESPTCMVVPPSLVCMLTTGGFDDPRAPIQLTTSKVSLRIFRRSDQYFIRNTGNEITPMKNRWDLIEPVGTDTSMLPYYAEWGGNQQVVEFDFDTTH